MESSLSNESEERKKADFDNLEYSRKQTKWSNVRSWIGVAVSILALMISAIANWDKILAFLGL